MNNFKKKLIFLVIMKIFFFEGFLNGIILCIEVVMKSYIVFEIV